MLKRTKARSGWRPGVLLLAFLIGIAGLVAASPVAQAAEVNAIDRGSIRLSKLDAGDPVVYLWSGVRIDAQWRIPDQSGKAGDTFRLNLPKEIGGSTGSFELKGAEGDPLTYGTCEVRETEVVCTFNENVEGKNNVGGSLWVSAQVSTLINTDKVTFPLSSGPLDVPLPDGQRNIGYSPKVPTEINKSGWFPTDDLSVIHWRIVVPGSRVADRSRMVITDNYAVTGTTLTVINGNPSVYWVPNTPKCWNESYTDECHHSMDASTTPSLKISVDDSKDVVTATIDNKGKKFEADRLYVFDLGPIPAGAQYSNKATVDAEHRTATAVKSVSGGGTGSGDTVGHLAVKKAVVGGQVPTDTAYPVTWSYQYKGQTRSGELAVKADGALETLNNVPNGTVVTLTEKVPSSGDIDYGDPTFSGQGVADGVPDANSAQVTVEGLKTVEVSLTNHVNPKLVAVEVTPGVCTPGSSEPSKPTVKVGETDGITYSAPKFTTSGDKVSVEVTATPATGREIDDQHLPEGWKANSDGTYTFTTTITQPNCVKTVTPVIPTVGAQACPVDSTIPSQPTVTVAETPGVTYGQPEIKVADGKVTVTVTATAQEGHEFGGPMPDGWKRIDAKTAVFAGEVELPVCEVPTAPSSRPRPTPSPSVTPTPVRSLPAPVRPGLPKTGA